MTGKVSETLQNDCLVCYLHKKLRLNLNKIHFNGNHGVLIDVLDLNSPATLKFSQV